MVGRSATGDDGRAPFADLTCFWRTSQIMAAAGRVDDCRMIGGKQNAQASVSGSK